MLPSQDFTDQEFMEQKSADSILLPYGILPFSHVRYDFFMLDSAILNSRCNKPTVHHSFGLWPQEAPLVFTETHESLGVASNHKYSAFGYQLCFWAPFCGSIAGMDNQS